MRQLEQSGLGRIVQTIAEAEITPEANEGVTVTNAVETAAGCKKQLSVFSK